MDQIQKKCSSDISKDPLNFGISCTSKQLSYKKIHVDYYTDVFRLKQDAARLHRGDVEAQANAEFLVIVNATLLTMETGDPHQDVFHDGILVTRDGKIEVVVGIGEMPRSVDSSSRGLRHRDSTQEGML